MVGSGSQTPLEGLSEVLDKEHRSLALQAKAEGGLYTPQGIRHGDLRLMLAVSS